jgi:hypothetical protein
LTLVTPAASRFFLWCLSATIGCIKYICCGEFNNLTASSFLDFWDPVYCDWEPNCAWWSGTEGSDAEESPPRPSTIQRLRVYFCIALCSDDVGPFAFFECAMHCFRLCFRLALCFEGVGPCSFRNPAWFFTKLKLFI